MKCQIDKAFVNYLGKNFLQNEHRAYLNSRKLSPADSLEYYKARFFLNYFNDSLFISSFEKSKNLSLSDTNLVWFANLSYLKLNDKKRDLWVRSIENERLSPINKQLLNIYNAATFPENYSPGMFPEDLRADFASHKKSSAKKPALGALMSAGIPGTGKWYAGRPQSFLLTFLINAIYATQSIESINKLGWKHPFSIVNTGIFAAFYFANIYGGYSTVKQAKHEKKIHFLNHAEEYYNLSYPVKLH